MYAYSYVNIERLFFLTCYLIAHLSLKRDVVIQEPYVVGTIDAA